MEDVVVSFTGWTGPDVALGVASEHRQKRIRKKADISIGWKYKKLKKIKKKKDLPKFLDILKIAYKNLMVHCCS